MAIIETNQFPTPTPQADGYGFTTAVGTGTPSAGSYRLAASAAGQSPAVALSDPASAWTAGPTTVAVRVKDVSGKGCIVRLSGHYYNADGSYDTWSDLVLDYRLGANETRTIIAQFPFHSTTGTFRPQVVLLPMTVDEDNAIGDNASSFEDTGNPYFWGATGATLTQSTDRAHLGTRSLKVVTTAGQKPVLTHSVALSGESIPADFCAYTFTARVSAATAIAGDYDISATWYDNDWGWLGDSNGQLKSLDVLDGLGSSWRQIRHTFVVPATAQNVDITIAARANVATSETWHLDSCRLEQGERPRVPAIPQAQLASGDAIDILEVGVYQGETGLVDGIAVVGKPGCRWAGTAHRSNTVRRWTVPLIKRATGAQVSSLSIKGATNGEVLLRGMPGPHALARFPEPPHPFDDPSTSVWRQEATSWIVHPNSANIIGYVASTMSAAGPYVSTHDGSPSTSEKWGRVDVRATLSDPVVKVTAPPEYAHPWLDPKFTDDGFHLPADAIASPNSDSGLTVVQPDGSVVWLWQFFRATMTCSSAYWVYPGTNGLPAALGGDPRNIGPKHPHCQTITRYDMAVGRIDRSILSFLPPLATSSTRVEFPQQFRDGTGTDPNVMVMGWRLCIKQSVNLDALNLHPAALVVARMLQEFGATQTDTNSPTSGMTLGIDTHLAPGMDNPPYYMPSELFKALPISSAMWEVRYHPQANP